MCIDAKNKILKQLDTVPQKGFQRFSILIGTINNDESERKIILGPQAMNPTI